MLTLRNVSYISLNTISIDHMYLFLYFALRIELSVFYERFVRWDIWNFRFLRMICSFYEFWLKYTKTRRTKYFRTKCMQEFFWVYHCVPSVYWCEWVWARLSDDGENEQTKINSICLHVEMCMSDCRKTVQKFHFSLCNMEWITVYSDYTHTHDTHSQRGVNKTKHNIRTRKKRARNEHIFSWKKKPRA